MPDFKLTPAQENELNGFVAQMEADELSSDEISEVVNNYISEKASEVYKQPQGFPGASTDEPVIGPIEGTPEQVAEADEQYAKSIEADPLEETLRRAIELTPDEQLGARESALSRKTELFEGFGGRTGEDVYSILGSEDAYREYLEFLQTGEVEVTEYDIAKASKGIQDFKERQFMQSLPYADRLKAEEISKNAKARLKVSEKESSKYAPLVEQKRAVVEPMAKQLEELRLAIDRSTFTGEDVTEQRKAYKELRGKIEEETEGYSDLLNQFLKANKNTLNDAQAADAFGRTYSLAKRIGQPFEELESDISIMVASFLTSYDNPHREEFLRFKESKLEERKVEEAFRANNLPKPVNLEDINSIASFAAYAGDALINNAPSVLISAAGSFSGLPYLAYPLFFGMGAGAKISEHELLKQDSSEEIARIDQLLKTATDKDQIAALSQRKRNIENALSADDWQVWLAAAGHGTAELVFERFGTMKIFDNIREVAKLGGKVNLKQGFKNVSNKIARNALQKTLPFAEGFTIESLTEGATTLTQNWFDINVLGEEKTIDEGLSDSLLQGGIIGGVIQSGGTLSSSLVNSIADEEFRKKIYDSNTRVNAYLRELNENLVLTEEGKAGLIGRILREANTVANVDLETLITKFNQLTPKDQREVLYQQSRIDILNSQRATVERSNVSEDIKNEQLEQIDKKIKEHESEKSSVLNSTLNLLEIAQLDNLDVTVDKDITIEGIKSKIEENNRRTKERLTTLRRQLKANQVGPNETAAQTTPLQKIIDTNDSRLKKIEQHEDKLFEEEVRKTKGVATEAEKAALLAEKKKAEEERQKRLKYKIKTDASGKITEVSDDEGNLASPATAAKRVREHIPNMDLVGGRTLGQQGIYPRDEAEGVQETYRHSENPFEIARVLEFELAKDPAERDAKGYVEQHVIENVRITTKDYDHYGDPKRREGISRAWFRKDATPLDTQAQEISDILGVEVTEQDIIDIIDNNSSNPNRYVPKISDEITSLRLRFHELTGVNLTPTNLSIVLKEGYKQLESKPDVSETAEEALAREAAERRNEYEQALHEIYSQEREDTAPAASEDTIARARIQLQNTAEIQQARDNLRFAVERDVDNGVYDITIDGDNYTTEDIRAAHRILGGATKRGLDATYTPGEGGQFFVEIIDPLIPQGEPVKKTGKKTNRFDDIIAHLDEVYENMKKDGTILHSTIVPIPSKKALLGLFIDALKAVRALIRGGSNIASAINDTYDLVKDYLTKNQWSSFVKSHIAAKEAQRLKLLEDELNFIYGDTAKDSVSADLDSISKTEYPKPVEIADPLEESPEQLADLLENTPIDTFNDVVSELKNSVSGIKVAEVKDTLYDVPFEQSVALFGITLLTTKFHEGVSVTEEGDVDALEEEVDVVNKDDGIKKDYQSFATRFGRLVNPDPKHSNGKPMTSGEANLFYGKLAHVFVEIGSELGIIEYDIGYHTNNQYQVKVVDPKKLNDLVIQSALGTTADPKYYGIYRSGELGPITKFRQDGYDLISNAAPEVLEEYAERTDANAGVYDPLSNARLVDKVVDRDVLGIQLHPAYQNSDIFTYNDKNYTEEERRFKQAQDQLALRIGVELGTDAYNIPHTYGFRFRMYARSLGWNYQANKKVRSSEKFSNAKPLGDLGWYFLNIQLTDAFGESLIKPEDRYNFAVNNRSKGWNFMQIVKNPFSPESVALVNRAKEPIKFLATVWEMGKALQHEGGPQNYPSGLKIAFDYVSSVNQHQALILRTPELFRVTNLSVSQDKFDTYIEPGIDAIESIVPPLANKELDTAAKKIENQLNRYRNKKDKALKQRNAARDAYIRKGTQGENKTLSSIKKKLVAADKANRSKKTPPTRLDILRASVQTAPTKVKEVLERMIKAEVAYNEANRTYTNFKNRKPVKAAQVRVYTQFFGTPARKADMRTPGKISNMIGNYGAGIPRIGRDIYDALRVDPLYEGITLEGAKWLAKRLVNSTNKIFPEQRSFLEFAKVAGKQAAELNIPIKWRGAVNDGLVVQWPRYVDTKPVGLVVRHPNENVRYSRKTKFDGRNQRIFPKFAVGFKDAMIKAKQESSLAANFIHNGDAQTPAYVFERNDYDADFTHDDGATIGADAAELFLDMRRVLIEVYDGKTPIEDFLKLNPKLTEAAAFYEEILKPLIGNEDVKDVMLNPSTAGGGVGFSRVSEAAVEDLTIDELAERLLDTMGPVVAKKLEQTSKIIDQSDKTIAQLASKARKVSDQLDIFGEYYKSNKKC